MALEQREQPSLKRHWNAIGFFGGLEAESWKLKADLQIISPHAHRIRYESRKDGAKGLAVLAVQQIRRMRGGAQGQLMLGADGNIYVVKFQNNPQHMRVLANEFLVSRLAMAVGLTVPETELVEVSSWLIENTPELDMDLGRTRVRCRPGLQFGSRFAGGLMPGQVVDYLPEEKLAEVRNLGEFAGILAWTSGPETPTDARRCSRAGSGSGATGQSSSTSGIAFTPGNGDLRMRRCAGFTIATTCTAR